MSSQSKDKLPARGTTAGPVRRELSNATLQQHLEWCCKPLGLVRDPDSYAHAACTGKVAGRMIQIGCARRARRQFNGFGNISIRKFAGLVLDIRVSTKLQTRLTLTPPGNLFNRIIAPRIYKRLGLLQINNPDPVYTGLQAWTNAPDWAHAFLSDNRVIRIVGNVSGRRGSQAKCELVFTPENVTARYCPAFDDLKPGQMRHWLTQTMRIAELAET